MAHRRRGVGVSRTRNDTIPRSGQRRNATCATTAASTGTGTGIEVEVDAIDTGDAVTVTIHAATSSTTSTTTNSNNTNTNSNHKSTTAKYDQGVDKLQKKTDEIHELNMTRAVDTIETLQRKLTKYAQQHQAAIQQDPVFRSQFLQMCAPLGVDPLLSQKGFWAKTLGVGIGDFYYELSVKVAEVCFATRTKNGGIMSVTDVCDTLNNTSNNNNKIGSSSRVSSTTLGRKKRPSKSKSTNTTYSRGDVTIAVQKLSTLGGGFRIVTVGTNCEMIVSVPTELDHDHMEIMTLAAADRHREEGQHQHAPEKVRTIGCITVEDVYQHLKWTTERTDRAITLLLNEGMAWKDEYHGIAFYWFPSIWNNTMAL